MFKAVNNKVEFLKRIKFGKLELDDLLKPGEYKNLTNEEINTIF